MLKPAARIGDMHLCSKTTADIPHVGGPILVGSPNVFINGRPAARVGDLAVCVGPPDRLAQGSRTVFINGKAAVRVGDRTEHGGFVILGSVNVFIGDGSSRAKPSRPCAMAAKASSSSLYSDQE